MEATMSNDSPLSEARTDFYTVVHKALRKQLFEAIMVAGSTDYGDSDDRTRVARAVAEVVKRFRDHADHEEQFLHPVIAEVLPATEQALHAQHEEHSRGLDEVERAFEMALADRTGASGHRAYRALSRFAGHSLAHMEEEEAGQARLWELAGETRLAAAMAAFKRSRTFERVAGPKCVGRPRDAETAAVTYNVLGASVVTATANQFERWRSRRFCSCRWRDSGCRPSTSRPGFTTLPRSACPGPSLARGTSTLPGDGSRRARSARRVRPRCFAMRAG
jgi:hypothetical protein